ncbi:unnamed protein product, partial [Prorocentrum cordatum]
MQAALRHIAGRFAEGVSTGLVVWAGRPTCPHCECSPVLHCPPLTCSTGDVAYTSPLTPLALVFTCACVAVVAFSAGRLTGVRARTELNPEDLDATARAQVAQYRYNVGGPFLYHERLVTYLPLGAGLTVSVTTPDGDEYEEVWGMPDIVEWEPLPNRQQGGVLLGRPGARYYRFRVGAMPTIASLTAATTAAAARLGQPAPVGPVAPALGGRIAELPAGGALPGAPAAGGAAAPPGAVPGPPAAGAAADLGGVAPAAGLGGLVAALGGPAAGAPAGDARTLPVVYDMVGNRRREFRDAVLACREDQWEGWPVRGPRTTHWVLRYIVDHGGTPTGMHSRWRSEARLQEHEPGVQEHERACRALEELLCFDQCNGANLAAAELLARTIQVQQERYQDRSAGGTASGGHDSVDAHLFMGSELTRGGARACPLLQEWASLQLAKEQALLKERRKAREERELAKKGNKKKNNRDLSRVTRRRGAATKRILDWGDECIDALNDLHGHQDRPAVPANAAQRHAVDHVESQVRALGKPPPEAGFREGALRELLAGTGIYQTGDLSSRRPYVKESISWPSPDLQPVPLTACIGEAESEWLGRWQSTLLRPDKPTAAERTEFCPHGLFFDPSLFSKPLLDADFVAKLLARGMVELKRDCDAATVGCFFVAKKNKKLRVIFDTRYANLFFGRPARTALPTATALAAFENPGRDTYLASGDIDNAFYRLRLPDGLPSYFRLPALDASLLGITHLDGVPLARGARVQPCVCVLPIGWSHALALCQGVLRRAMATAGFTVDQCVEGGKAGVVVDREGAAAVAGYVDNYAALGRPPALVDQAALAITRVLTEKGLLTHDEEPAARDATFVGLELKRGRHLSIKARWRFRVEGAQRARERALHQAAEDSTGSPDKALENLLVDNPVAFDEAAVERAQNAQLVVASTVQTFGLSFLESAAIRPNAQRQCHDRLATLVLFCRMYRLDWDSWESLDNAVTALLNHQFLDGKCSDLGAQLIAVHSDVFSFGNFVMTQFTALVELGLAGPLFDQAAGNVTHLVDGGDVGAYLGKRLVASLGRAVRLRSLLFLELFGGCGRVAASAQAMGYAALSLDIDASPLENHLTPAFLNRILGWISGGAIAGGAVSVEGFGTMMPPAAAGGHPLTVSHDLRVGDFCVVRYNVGGPFLYHERLVTYLPLGAGLTVSVTTPDGDEYEEVWSMPDIVEWEPLPNRQQGGVLLGWPGARYYRFRVGAMPTIASLTAATTVAAARLGQPAPAGPVAPALGGRIAELPAGGVGAAPAGAAVDAPLLGAAGAAAVGAPPPVAFGGVPAAAAPAGGRVQDARALPVVYDMVGNRRREFRDAVLACREDQWEGLPVRGPRTTHWVLRYIVDHGGTPTGMHSRWRSEARLQEHEPGVQEHERACRALEELLCFDQCNGANLAAAELLARTIQVQQERYRDRSAGGTASGGHDGVDAHLFMGSELTRGGVRACPLLQEWASLQLAKEQALLKERRKAPEERELAKKGNKKKNNRDLSRVTRRRGAATKHILDWGDECIDALNDLHGHQDRPAVPANAAQRHAVDHVESQVRALGKPPPEAGFREGALRELLAGTGIYQTGDLSSRRPYVKESISWPSPDLQPVPLTACLGEAESEWLGRWQSTLLRPDKPTAAERTEFCPHGPFFDPSLFSKPLLYADFVAKLLARGMVELKRDCDAATVGCLFVAKKNQKLRVIFDTRYANLFFRRPARTALPTATALAAFENPGHDTYLASGDIDNAFYRLRLPDGLSSHFRLPALDASLLGITHLDGVPLARGARVQPCVCVLPMGWSHALALCQGVLRRAMATAGFTVDQCVEDGKAGVVVDREGAVAVAGYVDNYAALGRSPALVDQAALAIARVLTEKGLLTHDEEPAARDATFVGLELKRGRHLSIKA